MIYGHDRTWHQTTDVNVELNKHGEVVAVWFRCISLPFTQNRVDKQRADEMLRMYKEHPPYPLVAVEVDDTSVAERPH